MHIVWNKELYHTCAEEIEPETIRKEDEQHGDAHAEGVDYKEFLSSPSVRKRLIEHTNHLEWHRHHGEYIKHANTALAEAGQKIVCDLGFHKGTDLGCDLVGHIYEADDQHEPCVVSLAPWP